MAEVIIVRRCSEAESRELMGAWIDYCTSYWLIAYGNLQLEGNEPEEWVDWQIDKQRYPWYVEEVERIRRKYESTDSKS